MATLTVTHRKVSSGTANPNVEVDLSNWNDTHVVAGLENVDNTSDANKPVSTAQAAALALKANIASPAFTGPASFSGTITGNSTGGSTGGAFLASAATPAFSWQATGQAADQKVWDTVVAGTSLQFRVVNDANSAAAIWMTVTRGAGATVSSVSIPNLAIVKGDVGLGNVDNTSDATKNAAAVSLTNKTISATTNTIQIPYFSASLSANQAISNNTATKINLNTELADSNSWYDNVTNFRFTPQLAGKYKVTGSFAITATTITEVDIYIYKNGAIYSRQFSASSTVSALSLDIGNIVSFNGSTDYVELWCLVVGTGTINVLGSGAAISTWFEAQYLGA